MYGILFTMHTGHVASMEHIDGIPTKELAESIKKEWFAKIEKYKDYATALVYEMEKPKQEEQPLFTYSTGPAGATISLTQEQLLDKVDMLCTKLNNLKMFICDDATSTSVLVEEVTLAHHLAHELWDALPNEDPDDGAVGEVIKRAYGGETKNG